MDERVVEQRRQRVFWLRLLATTAVMSVPLAYGIVVLDITLVPVVAFCTVASVALLAIWDGMRLLPAGLVFWAKPQPLRDMPTGLYNPEGWTQLLAAEDDRCRRHGHPASIIVIRVEAAGDEAEPDVARAGFLLRDASRAHDVVAYLDGGTFAVLAINSSADQAVVLADRACTALTGDGFVVHCHISDRHQAGDLPSAWHRAAAAAA